jgi:streptomycin 6-kinase
VLLCGIVEAVNAPVDLPDNLHYYLDLWDLAEPRLLRETYTSRIYTVTHGGSTAVLKLLARHETEEQRGATSLRCFGGRGAVQLLRSDAGAQLLEYADGPELFTLVQQGEDAEATRIIGAVIAQLHRAPPPHDFGDLLPLDRWFAALFAQAAADREARRDTIYVRGAAVAAELLAAPRDVRVLHGDIHHYNIRHSPRGGLAFDPKGLVGERTYDCANTLCNPVLPALVFDAQRLLANAAILADTLALDRRRILAFTYAYACLNASQWLALGAGGEIQQWSLRVAAVVEPHLKGAEL